MTTLCGCASYRAAPLQPRQSAEAFEARRLDDPALLASVESLFPKHVAAWPPPAWNRGELFAVALLQNPKLAVAHAHVEVSRAAEMSAAARPDPDLTLESEYARHDVRPWLYGLALDWPLTNSKQHRIVRDVARQETLNRTFQSMEETWAVRMQLVDALSQWEAATRGLALLQRLADAEDGLIDITRRRVAAGEDAATELVALERDRADTEGERIQLRARLASARAQSADAIGVPATALNDIQIDWPDWGSPPPVSEETRVTWRERALLSRADLEVAMGDYTIAERNLELAVSRQYPRFTIGPGYYWDHGIAKFPLDLGLSLPFNRNQGQIAEARAEREVAARRMLAVQADIVGLIDAAEGAERLAQEAVAAAAGQLSNARQQARRVDLEVGAGAAGRDRSLATAAVSLRAELGLLDARAGLQAARNRLEESLRAPLCGPELALSTAQHAQLASQ